MFVIGIVLIVVGGVMAIMTIDVSGTLCAIGVVLAMIGVVDTSVGLSKTQKIEDTCKGHNEVIVRKNDTAKYQGHTVVIPDDTCMVFVP